MENKEDIRKGFEVWARDSFYSGLACVSDTWSEKRRLYTDAAHHMALMAWQHQAARIAELERENRYLQDVCAELEAQVQQLQREKEGMCLLPAKEWGELDYWLARCEDKGRLENCPDLVEPYNALYAAIADHNIK